VPTAQQALPALPFTASSHEHVELAATLTVTPTTAVQQLNPIDIPASGYFRSLFIEVVAAGGAGGTLAADAPWNIISSLALKDVNGSHIISPIDGYALYMANVFGGFDFNNNPANVPWFSGSAPNPAFGVRVPVEVIARDALGALANQNSAANYKLELAINSIASRRRWRTPPRPCSPSACGTKGGPFPPHSRCGASRNHRFRHCWVRVSTSTPFPVRSWSARTTPPSTVSET
jgi:hypothetical protein